MLIYGYFGVEARLSGGLRKEMSILKVYNEVVQTATGSFPEKTCVGECPGMKICDGGVGGYEFQDMMDLKVMASSCGIN